jgi:hypothetical protein
MFKLEKWFTIFKNIYYFFFKLKKNFRSNEKYFLLTIILRMSHQTPENTENIFRKSLYAKQTEPKIKNPRLFLYNLN